MKQKILNLKLTLALLVAMLLSAATMQAQEPDLRICGVKVTQDNCNNLVTVINGVSGCSATGIINYNFNTRTLTLKNATITTSTYDWRQVICLNTSSTTYTTTIKLVGSNSITKADGNNSSKTTLFCTPVVIEGDGFGNKLTINSNDIAMEVNSTSSVTIRNCILDVTSTNNKAIFSSTPTATLAIDNAMIKASGSQAIAGFSAINLTGVSITAPRGAKVTNGSVTDAAGNIISGSVDIAQPYDLSICGMSVTAFNKDDLSVIPGVSGTVSYNPDTKVLSLNNANINMASGANTIMSKIDGLTINVQGTNNVSSDDYATVRFEKSATIEGGGTLNVSQNKPGDPGWSIYANNLSLTIRNCKVNTTNGSAGIIGNRNGTLTIENATVSAGSSTQSISRFADIVLRSAAITAPSGAVVSNGPDTFKAVRDANGNILSGTVKIEPAYDLWICGKQAMPQNKDNLQALTVGASGTLKYNPVNKKLTMNNLVINDFVTNINEPRIKSDIEGLTIEILGNDNNIYQGLKGIELNGSTTIIGGGKLRLSNSGYEFGIHSTAQLTIRSCTVDVVSQNGGITGNGTNKLTIDNATVTANATNAGVITNFGNIVLKNSLIAAPQGVMVSKASDSFFAFRNNLTGNVIVNQQINIVPGIIYNLWINGVQVNSQNKGDLTVIPGVTGTASYNSDTKTLSLNNATMSITGSTCCILSKIDGMAIDVTGTNTLNSNGWSTLAYEDDNSGIIRGSGTLNLNNDHPDDAAIHIRSGSLTVENCTLNGTGKKYGIYSSSGNSVINIDNATVSMKGEGTGSIYNVAALNLNGCIIAQPMDAYFDETEKTVVSGNTAVKTEVKILPGTAYDLSIGAIRVTSFNKDDLTVINGYNGCTVSGGVSYNPDTRNLTLNGATITTTSGDAIVCLDGGVNIELIGDNTVTSGGMAIGFYEQRGQASGSIYGSGTLNVTTIGAERNAIYVAVPLTIRNCTVNAVGTRYGLYCNNNSKLTIDGATVSATGTGVGSIVGFSELSLLNCAIAQPLKAVYDENQNAIVADGNIVNTQVDITPGYGLWICGTQVTDANRADLTAISGVSGTAASYDPATNILSLNAATISSTSNKGAIFSKIDDMKIVLTGNSSVTSTVQDDNVCAIEFYGTASNAILGSGTLNVKANGLNTIKVLNTLNINNNCTLNVTGAFKGNGTSSWLYFDNANVSVAVGEGAFSPVQGFVNVSFSGCGIVQPAGAAFNPGLKQICDKNGNPVLSDIRIEPVVSHNLWVAGEQVTNLTQNDLTLIPDVTGTAASYDPLTLTLRLENADITTASMDGGIYSTITGLQIELIGTNKIEATHSNAFGISFMETAILKGSGTLHIETTNVAIYTEASQLTIMNCTVDAVDNNLGIYSDATEGTALTIKNATVSATGAGYGSIIGFRELNLYSCKLTQPAGAYFDAAQKAVCDANGIVKTTVKIEPTYGLTVCGVEVTDANKDDLTAIPGVTGIASYNAQTKTLRLENAVIASTTADAAIRAESDTLKIELAGNNNKVTASQSSYGIYLLVEGATICGNGKLSVNAQVEALYVKGFDEYNPAALTLKDITLTAVGDWYGIWGTHSKLILDAAAVSATGTAGGSIYGFDSIDLKDCKILSPADAVFNPTVKAVCDAQGNIITGEVKIMPTYELYICGVQVTALNQNDLTVINGTNGCTVSGSVKYIPETKTLRLDGAAITAIHNDAIRFINGGINIELIGNNTVTGVDVAILVETYSGEIKPVTICGSGTLNVNADTAIETEGGSLTIKNCTINATGGIAGIYCGDTLTIDSATVSAIGTLHGSIHATKHLQLIDCMVSQPAGAAYDATRKYICDANGVVKSEVKIIPAYDLTICNVQVNALNKDDLTVINGTNGCTVSGSVKFIPETNTLRLENANIRATVGNGITNAIDGLKIEVIGNNNTVESANGKGIEFFLSGSIEDSGSLTVNAPNFTAICTQNNDIKITIKNCTVTANGGDEGITGAGANTHLIIDNATVSATGTNSGSIIGFKKLTLNHCVITQPVGAFFNTSKKAVCDSNSNFDIITSEVKIIPGYELEICGERVTPSNMNDLTVINGTNGCTVTGSVSYNPETNTLRLENANIVGLSNSSAIRAGIDRMKIEVIGNNNTITSPGYSGIYFKDLTPYNSIEGNGSLTVSSPNDDAISCGDTLMIKNCTLTANGNRLGIGSIYGDKNLIIDNATVSATGTVASSIYGLKNIQFIGSKIVEPSGAVFNSTQQAICDSQGNPIKALVRIIPAYDLWVCGEQVTAENKDDLTVINGINGCTVSGSVKFIPETNTLRLENANIHATTNTAIGNSINGLKIEVIGNSNTVESSASSFGIEFYKSGSIEGGGSLTVNAPNGVAIKVSFDNVKITIKNCTVTANGGYAGIAAVFFSNTELVVDNATVSATGTNDGSIIGFEKLTLNHCVISQPADAVFDAGARAVIDPNTGEAIKTEVKIVPDYKLWVCGEKVTPSNMNDLTVINGTNGCTVSGSVKYIPETKTLRLENAYIRSITGKAIRNSIDGLKIEVIGNNNTVASANYDGIEFYNSGSIEGGGSLTVNAPNSAIYTFLNDIKITIKNCTVTANGGDTGIDGVGGNLHLIIDNATVSATGTNEGSIIGIDTLTLNSCVFTQPMGAVFNAYKGAVIDLYTRKAVKTEVKIIPGTAYDLSICGVQVTSLNKDDLTVINGYNGCTVSGSVKYIPETNTLRLENANIRATATGVKAIENSIDGLKIEVIGNSNTVESSAYSYGIEFYQSGSIEGGGSLTVNALIGIAIKASFDNVKITIKNCTVTANGGENGIAAGPFSNTELVVDNATVSATGTNDGSIFYLQKLTLNNCVIIQPTNAVFDLDDLGIKAVIDPNTGKAVKTEVMIVPANLPIFTGTGDWSIPTNWNTGTVPDATQKVIIDGIAEISSDLEVAGFVINAGKLIVVKQGKKLTVTNKSTNNGTIYLLSNATNGTATLVGDVAGKAIVCQAAVNYRTYYLSSPVSGTVTTSDNMGKYITFTESTDQWTPNPAEDFANISPVPGKGYGVQVSANVAESERGKATLISFTGTLNNGDVPIAITSDNRRFNFLGNPYPSYLNTIKVVANPNITKSLWFYSKLADNTPYQFTAYNVPTGISIPDAGHDYGYIPPMQGFWVKANEGVSTDYIFTNEMRVHKPAGSPAIFRAPQAEERQLLRLQLTNGIIKDEAAVLFSEEATNDWNTPKMTSQKLCIYTLKDGENLALNSSKTIEYDVEIPVGVKAESGVYTFSASKLENFGAERVFLLDKVANTTTNLSNNDIHTVNFKEAYNGTDRFALVFPRSGVISGLDGTAQTCFFAFAKDKRITVSSDAQSGTIYVYNSVGQQVAATPISSNLTTVSAVLQEGVYVVKLNNQTAKVVVK